MLILFQQYKKHLTFSVVFVNWIVKVIDLALHMFCVTSRFCKKQQKTGVENKKNLHPNDLTYFQMQ